MTKTAGARYLSREIESTRLDVTALGLVPLTLEDQGTWNPDEHYWGEEGEPIEEDYVKRFGKSAPDIVMPIEERARLEQQKTDARRAARPRRATEAS